MPKIPTYNYCSSLEGELSEEPEEREQRKKRKPSPAEEELNRSTRPRREKRDHKTEKEKIQTREPKIDEVIPQYLAEALEVAKPWAEEENKQKDGKKDMATSVESKEDEEQQKDVETED